MTFETSQTARRRLPEVDALRGIAACSVMAFHYGVVYLRVFPEAQGVPAGAQAVLSIGAYGVMLFFAISGFVITMTLERTAHAGDFAVRRFARLYPVYWAAILVTSGAVALSGEARLAVPPYAIAVNLTMVQGMAYVPSVDGVYWSLLHELCFYGCMLLLWRSGALRWPERVAIGWLAIKLACWLMPLMPWRLQMLLALDYIPFFLIGILVHRVWSGARRWRDQAPLLAACIATIALTHADGWAMAAAGLVSLLLLAAAVTGRARWLAKRPLLWLGAISYALYLTHQTIGYILLHAMEGAGAPLWLALPLTIAFALLLASALRRLIEVPAERTIKRRWQARATGPAATAPQG